MRLDLNCDLGEGEPWARTRALMPWLGSINVACGGHAGSPSGMQTCLTLARRHGIHVGAHPGYPDRAHFGRRPMKISLEELELLLLQQIGALAIVAAAQGMRLHHVKLHGALYHASEQDEALGRAYVRTMAQWWPELILYARAGGRVAQWARRRDLRVWEEAFIDRGYDTDGNLVARQSPGAFLTTPDEVEARVRRLKETGEIRTATGRVLRVRARTLCLHADGEHAVRTARIAARVLCG